MAFQISAPLRLKGYREDGTPDFGVSAPVRAYERRHASSAPVPSPDGRHASRPSKPNKFPGPCARCGNTVPAEQGQLVRHGDGWGAQHLDGTCSVSSDPSGKSTVPEARGKHRPVCVPGGGIPMTGYFTVEYGADQQHATLRFRRQPESASFRPGQVLVAYLSGSDNETSYTSVAHVDEQGRCWMWKRFQDNDWVRQAIAAVLGDQKTAGEAWARESEKCWRCGRRLTTPESLDQLIGPECAQRT